MQVDDTCYSFGVNDSDQFLFREGGEICMVHRAGFGNMPCTWEGVTSDAGTAPFTHRYYPTTTDCSGSYEQTGWGRAGLVIMPESIEFGVWEGYFDSGSVPRGNWKCGQRLILYNTITSPDQNPLFWGGWVELIPCDPCCPTDCFQMGSQGTMTAGCSGALRLFINDDFLSDNSGEWSGWVKVNDGPEVALTIPGDPGFVYGPSVQRLDRLQWYFTGGIDVCTPASVCPYGSAVYDPDGNLISGTEIPVNNLMPCSNSRRYTLCGIFEQGV